MSLLSYFGVSPDKPMLTDEQEIKQKYNRLRWSVFLSATLGYGMYYVCRLSLNVIKKPIVDAGVLSETELGINQRPSPNTPNPMRASCGRGCRGWLQTPAQALY